MQSLQVDSYSVTGVVGGMDTQQEQLCRFSLHASLANSLWGQEVHQGERSLVMPGGATYG
jgi:hypothetical protein